MEEEARASVGVIMVVGVGLGLTFEKEYAEDFR
jgi:hypothetical protein